MGDSNVIRLRPVEGIVFTGNNVDEVTEWIAKNIPDVDSITVTYDVDSDGERTAEIIFTVVENDPDRGVKSWKERVAVCTGCAVTNGIRRVYKPEELE